VHFWVKPLVRLIWIGGLLMALGGVLALGGKVRAGARRRSAEPQGALPVPQAA
jgi:cytochrome c-type biogenesis protein CcmF